MSQRITDAFTTVADTADRDLKAKHRRVWSLGDYPAVAKALIPDLGGLLVQASRIRPDQDVLDVAAGSGNATIPAAQRGARVVGQDLTPALLAAGKAEADSLGLDVDWQEGDAERMEFADDSFDVVISSIGVMFAPHHQQATDEMLRVVKPGGTIGLLSWTPEGFIGQMFAAVKPYRGSAPARGETTPAVGFGGPRPRPLRRPRTLRHRCARGCQRDTICDAGGVPRLLQEVLRTHHRDVPIPS